MGDLSPGRPSTHVLGIGKVELTPQQRDVFGGTGISPEERQQELLHIIAVVSARLRNTGKGHPAPLR